MARTWLERLTRIRHDDFERALPLTAAYGLVMAALYVLKPTRNALFLQHFRVEQLPYVLLLVAVAGAISTLVYARFAAFLRLHGLLYGLYVGFIASLLAFRVLIPRADGWVVYLFYLWVALYGLVATSVLWQVANAQFNAREARRVFGIIGTGGIAGAIVGGLCAGFLARFVGTENLLLVAVLCLVGSALCLRLSAPRPVIKGVPRASPKGALREIVGSRLLRLISVSVALVAVVAVVVDVQFNAVVEREFPDQDDKTAFFGIFFASINAAAILVQLLVTPRVLTSFGIGAGLLILPAALGVGSLGALVVPSLFTSVLPKLADGSLRHSVHKAASEVLFIPLPPALTRDVKLFIDTTVDAFFTGMGALLVLLLTRELGVSYRGLSVLSLGLIAVWMAVAVRARAAYVDTFRQALRRRELDVSELRINISDASTVNALVKALENGARRQLLYALDMLTTVRDARLLTRLPPLCRHEDPGVRACALRVLAGQRRGDPEFASAFLDDPDHGVRVEAVHYLCRHGMRAPIAELERLLADEDVKRRAAAVGYIAMYGNRAEHELLDEDLLSSLLAVQGADAEVVRGHVARALAVVRKPELERFWRLLLEDSTESVVREIIDSAGRSRDPVHLPWLLERLDDKRYRMDARLALANYGDTVLDEIDTRLGDPATSDRVRRTLPRILARIDSPRSVDILLRHAHGSAFKEAIVTALEKLRVRFPDLRFGDPRVDALLHDEIATCEQYATLEEGLLELDSGAAAELLRRAVREAKVRRLHCVFQLLSLCYPPKDIATAYRAISGAHQEHRVGAIELLDNVLSRELKAHLIPLVEREAVGARQSRSSESHAGAQALHGLFVGDDGWLRACALYAAPRCDRALAREWAVRAERDPDSRVRETAALVLRAMAGSGLPAAGIDG